MGNFLVLLHSGIFLDTNLNLKGPGARSQTLVAGAAEVDAC